jgi:hypothetical protein
MKKIKLITFIMITLAVTGCNCKRSYMSDNFIVMPDDKNLNCQEIIYAINETEFWMRNAHERCKQPHIFSKFLPCTPMVKLDAIRNQYILSDRIDYLRSLYTVKGCDKIFRLYHTSIERQSRKIEQTRNFNNKSISNTIIKHNMREIPTNIG